MSIGPERAALILFISQVVNVTHNRLKKQQGEKDEANDGMIAVQQANLCRRLLGEPYANPNRRCIHEVCEELEQAVDQPGTTEGTQADQDTANGEKQDKS